MTGAQILVNLLERQGIEILPGIPGGANLPIYEALYHSKIKHILARHEQAAGFIAQGMSRSTGKPAACLATSGPGATNLITAIADAKLDSVPIVAITGQVSSKLIGTDAFQEVDTYGMTIPITKHNFLARNASELLSVIPQAFSIACSSRPGPVLVDIPKDVQSQETEFDQWPDPGTPQKQDEPDYAAIETAADLINSSARPVIYAGGGIISSPACQELKKLAQKNSIPVALTLMGLGCFAPRHPLYLGMLGMHGRPGTNHLMKECDLLLAMGTRFDDRATGNLSSFCPKAKIIHADIDSAEINKLKQTDVAIKGDIYRILSMLIPLVKQKKRSNWIKTVNRLKNGYRQLRNKDAMHPLSIIKTIQGAAPRSAIITTDVGQHQMWTAQGYEFGFPRSLLTSGGLGTMGFGLPCAIGAALYNPGKHLICVTGDGSLLMNIQELATLSELGLPVTVIVMNNGRLGLVRQQQELFYGGKYIACEFANKADFCAIARGFGLKAFDLKDAADIPRILGKALSLNAPSLVNIRIRPDENVYPMVKPGEGNCEMIGEKDG